MSDLDQKERAASVFIMGADADGKETNPVGATSNRELTNVDTVNNGGLDSVIALNTTAVEGKVGPSRKAARKYVWMQGLTVPAGANAYILWGFTSGTQSFKLFKDQLLCFPIGEGTQIWFKVPAGTGSVAFGEGS